MNNLKEVTIYTHGIGPELSNPGPGGYGIILTYKEHQKGLSGGIRLTTSRRMQTMATVIGLKALKCACSVRLYTDYDYLIKTMTIGWIQKLSKSNWENKRKTKFSHSDIWIQLLDLNEKHKIVFLKPEDALSREYNEICKSIALKAASNHDLHVDNAFELTQALKQDKHHKTKIKPTSHPEGYTSIGATQWIYDAKEEAFYMEEDENENENRIQSTGELYRGCINKHPRSGRNRYA